ncbi:DUF4136 domain-containing protein [Cellulophaga baltica]|uniref:DUF4136 domain-containing protein n=1 Tax=Cellulophaga baltica 18 TaxID=1348584 RepID=A0AAU8R7I1_9FLAO|nr:DUF4136 domain-containing protein [Cellulophaga baltica]AIZ40325.1 hypothetical protein M666_01245 [Cellulophaga baltica 18]
MKKIGFLMVLFFVVSCAAVRVNYDYDTKTDFTSYTTYNYYPDFESGLSGLDEKRILVLIDSTMQAKGIQLSEEPDFFINVQSNEFQAPQSNNVGGGISIGLPVGQPKLEREIQIDFVDSQKEFLFWQAVSASGFKENATPEAREQKLRQIVDKVFDKYPPKAN